MKVYQKWLISAALLVVVTAGALVPLLWRHANNAHAADPLPNNWWRHVTGERRLKPIFNGFTLEQAQAQLDTYKQHGYRVINLDWPVVSGPNSFNDGFTAEDFYHVDPRLTDSTATADQAWSNFLDAAHSKGLAVDSWFNIGFAPPDADYFRQAEQEVAAGNTTGPHSDWFMWSTDGNAPSPAPNNDGNGRRWVYDTTAGQYYWASWCTDDFQTCGPEFNWAKTSWQNEAKNILKHWLDTGIDGFVLDNFAQNANITDDIARTVVTNTIKSYGNNKFVVGECCSLIGGIDSREDFTFQNNSYGPKSGAQAVNSGDPSGLEDAFSTRDSIASAGAVSYMMDYDGKYQYSASGANTNHSGQLLEIATVAAAGEFYVVRGTGYGNAYGDLAEWPSPDVDSLSNIFNTINSTPALQPSGTRKKLATNDDHKYYAFLRTSDDGTQQAVVVLNYQPSLQTITINDTNLPSGSTNDLLGNTSGPTIANNSMTVHLNAFGYGYYLINTSSTSGFNTGFESGDPQPTYTSTVDADAPGGGSSNMSGFCCSLTGPETVVRTETAHAGSSALVYSGQATSTSAADFAYEKIFDLSSKNLTVGSNTTLSYWIYPQSSSAANVGSYISGNNSTCVAVDLIFSDSTSLRDSGAVDQNGNRAHPAYQCGHLTLDNWNHVTVNLGTNNNGKTINRLDVGYDEANSSGGYRSYIDDISISG